MTYVKSHRAAIGALVVALIATFQQAGHIDRSNVVAVGIAVLGVLLSFTLQNTAGGVRHYSQAIISTLVVAGQIVAPFVINGRITYAELVIVAVSVVQGALVYWEPDTTTAGGPVITRAPEHLLSVEETADKARYATS